MSSPETGESHKVGFTLPVLLPQCRSPGLDLVLPVFCPFLRRFRHTFLGRTAKPTKTRVALAHHSVIVLTTIMPPMKNPPIPKTPPTVFVTGSPVALHVAVAFALRTMLIQTQHTQTTTGGLALPGQTDERVASRAVHHAIAIGRDPGRSAPYLASHIHVDIGVFSST